MAIDFFNPVFAAVNRWVPSKRFRSEEGYRDDLAGYLQRELGGYSVKPEARRRMIDIGIRGRGLLGVGESVGIEMKADLQAKSEKDRLVGQLETDVKHFQQVICVLCGDTDPELGSEVAEWVRSRMFSMRQVHLVFKK